MTFPVIASRTTTVDAGTDFAHAIGLGSPSAGDLLLVFFSANLSTPSSIVVHEAISGAAWTAIAHSTSGNSSRLAVFAKIAAGGGGDVLTLLTNGAVRATAVCYRITGHGSSVAVGSFASATSTNGDPPAVSISGAAQDVLFIAALASASSVASAAPASYGTLTTAAGTISAVSTADRNLNATTDNPGTFTNTSQNWTAVAVAVPELAITSNARASQVPVEMTSGIDPTAYLSQLAPEVLSGVTALAYLSQLSVEMVSENVPDDNFATQPVMLFIAT